MLIDCASHQRLAPESHPPPYTTHTFRIVAACLLLYTITGGLTTRPRDYRSNDALHHITQLGRPDFVACKIRWKHIAQCWNLASHFASSKTLIFNKGFAYTNVHWNLYIVFIAIHYVLHCILPYAEHVPHAKLSILFWILQSAFIIMLHVEYDKLILHHVKLG